MYTKGAKWEIFNAPVTASWTINKLCHVTTLLRPWICKDEYSIKEVYESGLGISPKVQWRHLVWNRLSIPKTRFIYWLATKQGLRTKDKLKHVGAVDDDSSPLRGIHFETHTQLFFDCPFSLLCAAGIKAWTGIVLKPFTRMDFKKCGLSRLKQVMTAVNASIIYHIWNCRNETIWNHFVPLPRCIIDMIKADVSQRCHALNIKPLKEN